MNEQAQHGRSLAADAIRFAFPTSLAWLMLVISIAFLAWILFVTTMAWVDPSRAATVIALVSVAVFGAFAALGLRTFFRSRDSVAVSDDGVWYLPHQGDREPTFIAWNDVASVEAHDVQQRLVIKDTSGLWTIGLEYQLQDFGKLRDYVVAHTDRSTRVKSTLSTVFHRTLINKVIFLGVASINAALAWLSFDQGQWAPASFFFGLGGLMLTGVIRDPSQVEISRSSILIRYPFWQRRITFNEITSIQLTDLSDRGHVWAAIIINRKDGKPVRLLRFREGSLALNEALQAALKATTEKS